MSQALGEENNPDEKINKSPSMKPNPNLILHSQPYGSPNLRRKTIPREIHHRLLRICPLRTPTEILSTINLH